MHVNAARVGLANMLHRILSMTRHCAPGWGEVRNLRADDMSPKPSRKAGGRQFDAFVTMFIVPMTLSVSARTGPATLSFKSKP